VRCRQLEKILFPPELAILLAELGQFSPFLAGKLTLLGRTKVTPINPGLPEPLGQAADGDAKSLGHSPAAEALTEAELNSLLLLLCRELAS
jgi:hypothetical protein